MFAPLRRIGRDAARPPLDGTRNSRFLFFEYLIRSSSMFRPTTHSAFLFLHPILQFMYLFLHFYQSMFHLRIMAQHFVEVVFYLGLEALELERNVLEAFVHTVDKDGQVLVLLG